FICLFRPRFIERTKLARKFCRFALGGGEFFLDRTAVLVDRIDLLARLFHLECVIGRGWGGKGNRLPQCRKPVALFGELLALAGDLLREGGEVLNAAGEPFL